MNANDKRRLTRYRKATVAWLEYVKAVSKHDCSDLNVELVVTDDGFEYVRTDTISYRVQDENRSYVRVTRTLVPTLDDLLVLLVRSGILQYR